MGIQREGLDVVPEKLPSCKQPGHRHRIASDVQNGPSPERFVEQAVLRRGYGGGEAEARPYPAEPSDRPIVQ